LSSDINRNAGIAPFAGKRRGLLLVLSSPSGAGKTTITQRLVASDAKVRISISTTTRPKRRGEIDGTHYHFVSEQDFKASIAKNEFLEYAQVFGNWYGTPRAPVERALRSGLDVVTDVDWQGTQQLRQNFRDDMVSVFILPPTIDELERRLKSRAQDDEKVVQERMAKANDEMSHWPEYDYVIVNSDLDEAVAAVVEILQVERLKRIRQPGLTDFVRSLRGGA